MRLERIFASATPSPRASIARRLRGSGRVLDVGCGNFAKSYRYVHLANPELEILGVEYSHDASIYGKLQIPSKITATGKFALVGCDFGAQPLPFPDGTFDAAFCSHVIEHVPDREHLVDEIARVLKSGGYAYIETPGPRSTLVGERSRLYIEGAPYPYHYRDDATHRGEPLTLPELRGLLERAGLSVERSGYHREFGPAGLPLYALMFGASFFPFVPRAVRGSLRGIGYWNLVGWPIYALAEKATQPSR